MSAKACCGGSTSKVKVKQVKCCGSGTDAEKCACGSECSEAQHVSNSTLPEETACGCNGEEMEAKYIVGYIQTAVGAIPQVATKLDFPDTLGSWKCRWGIGRNDYTVAPGLYAVGSPDADSHVLVTANYKMTFDRLREQLSGLNLWIVVLDTDGINVWCAAGKGTFGTEEVVSRIKAIGLDQIVSHRLLILPQLGATGVAAHEVKKQSGFRVVYGPIKAKDIKEFLANGMSADEKMRTMTFSFSERIILTPMELVGHLVPLLVAFGLLFVLNAVGLGHYGWVDLYAALGAYVLGCVVVPALLPWIPGRAFSFKGGFVGFLWAAGVNLINGFPEPSYGFMPAYGWLKALAFMLLLPSVSAFCAMNFTGSSTFTSLSGVDKEMKIALPAMLIAACIGIVLIFVGDFMIVFG